MSTFLATFKNLEGAQQMLSDLLTNGVPEADISLVTHSDLPQFSPYTQDDATFSSETSTGSYLESVLGSQDPIQEFRGTAGASTADINTDIDSIDQSDDSQALFEEMSDPADRISNGEHESDDVALAYLTGFTTAPEDHKQIDEETNSMETISLPGGGTIMGGGALATASLDLNANPSRFRRFLIDDGMSPDDADALIKRLDEGETILAIEIVPGSVNEPMVERSAERWQAEFTCLFDAPRYREGGASVL